MNIKLHNSIKAAILLLFPFISFAQAPDLGTTSNFALFTAVGAFSNTGATFVTGDIGTNVGAFTGFPPGTVIGQTHVADPASVQAAIDVDVAYSDLSARTCGAVIGTTLGNNQVLSPNVYCLGAASTLNGDLVLDAGGNAGAIFIFKINGALSTTSLSRVVLVNGASSCNVYWQINGQVDLGAGSVFMGTIIANGAINLLESASLFGRGLSRAGAIALHNNIVTKGTPPVASIITAGGPVALCTGGSVVLSGNTGGTFNTGATTPAITVTAAGDYFVTNTNACGSVTSNHIIVTVGQQPTCTITGNGSLCPGQSTQLCVPAGAAGYLWSTGATTNCITVSTSGTYTVTVTNANGCTSTCSKTVTVSPQTGCTITGNGAICAGQSTQLCVPAGAAAYLWSTGATTNCITVTAAGTYSVIITNANGCTSTCSKTVTVNQGVPAVCTITGNSSLCIGQTAQLCAPYGYNYTYVWSTGATTRCITVLCTATFTVSVTVTSSTGCTSTCSKTVVVSPEPAPSCAISGDGSFCVGGSTALCAPAGNGYTYLWNTGATTRCISVSAAGAYAVTVTNANGCSSSCSRYVTVSQDPPPVCSIATGQSALCPGQSTELCAPYGYNYSYVWSTGATTRCITVNAPGTYSLTITNSTGCSSICSTTILSSASTLNCTITGSSIMCPGLPIPLCAPAGIGYTYLWSTGATTRCINANGAGTYTVTVSNGNGCSSTCSKTVTVSGSALTCTITGNSTICPGGSVTLCAPTGTGYTYLWSNGARTSCITVSAAGAYSVTVTNSTGCSSSCTKTITDAPLNCTITGNGTVCTGGSASLCAPAGTGYTYIWNNGATSRCITVTTGGAYSVTVSNGSGCTSTCSKTITQTPAPSAVITGPATICPGSFVSLCAPAGTGYAYSWSNGATSRCITAYAAGNYSVTVTQNGCSATTTKVIANATSGCPACNVCVPGRSTSGSDGLTFAEMSLTANAYPNPFNSKTTIAFQSKISGSHVVVELYNSKGIKVSTLFDQKVAKGGSYSVEVDGEGLSAGVYFYRIINEGQVINRKIVLIK